eukprot:TRINITY_DN5328_c0_g1_i4.p1 TRINITY_DN5328_c0_g1~~TRINITY_DN5328_c0_g1_i4.p1  ORF type:complete len:101 (+),score=19.22 TRINITY_DN5328_c0_g1_i4:22-303(+)
MFKMPAKIRTYAAPLVSGLIFGLGLGCSGMTSQAKVFDFLDVGGTWDPSLAFVMGCGLASVSPHSFSTTKRIRNLCAEENLNALRNLETTLSW